MLPPPDCAQADVCCDHFYVIAANILEVAHTAVTACVVTEGDCVQPIEGYVSVGGRINDPLPDRLVVSLLNVSPVPSNPNLKMFIPLFRVTYQVDLLESGWPQPSGDNDDIAFPVGEEYTQASRFAIAHAQVMYRALAYALANSTLNPFCDASCFNNIGPLVPVEPSGGTVGWRCTLTFDADLMTPGVSQL